MGHSQDQWGATSIRFVTETAAKLSFSCVNWVPIQIGWHKNISDMWRSNWTVDFYCSVIFTRVNRIETMYGRSRVNVKERTLLNLYVYAWSFIHCRFIYARTRVKKKKEKKSDSGNQPLQSSLTVIPGVCVQKLYPIRRPDPSNAPFSIFKPIRSAASCCC